MPHLLLPLLLACSGTGQDTASAEPPICDDGAVLFGAPTEATGLDTTQCAPRCEDCGGEPWSPPAYTDADFAAWRAWTLLDPPAALTEDPYSGMPPEDPGPDAVCAVQVESGGYRLHGYDSTTDALADGARVTHYGTCGVCSTLQDLAVYASTPDLTEPVRACGMENLGGDVAALTTCIEGLGFTHACATAWAYNTLHTRDACLEVCLALLDAPYHEADGSLNACLQCDEDESGAVFRATAGRTRRNTGLASTMCRPCSEVRPLVHDYGTPG
jgi:hypothetical protein